MTINLRGLRPSFRVGPSLRFLDFDFTLFKLQATFSYKLVLAELYLYELAQGNDR